MNELTELTNPPLESVEDEEYHVWRVKQKSFDNKTQETWKTQHTLSSVDQNYFHSYLDDTSVHRRGRVTWWKAR